MEPNQISDCLNCVHPIDESGQCLIAKMFENSVNPEHGCSWRVPIKRKTVLTNGDRIRQMTNEELAEWLDLHGECNQCAYHPAQCKTECKEDHLKWLRKVVQEDAAD